VTEVHAPSKCIRKETSIMKFVIAKDVAISSCRPLAGLHSRHSVQCWLASNTPVSGNTLGSLALKTVDSAKQLPGWVAGQYVAIGDGGLSTEQRLQVASTGLTYEHSKYNTRLNWRLLKITCMSARSSTGRSDVPRVWCLCSGVPVCLYWHRQNCSWRRMRLRRVWTCSYGLCDVHVGFPIFGRWPTITSPSTVTVRLQVVSGIATVRHRWRRDTHARRQPFWNTHRITKAFCTEFVLWSSSCKGMANFWSHSIQTLWNTLS